MTKQRKFDLRYLPIFVFWDLLEDSIPTTHKKHVDVFCKYLNQLSELEKRPFPSKYETDLLAEQRDSANLARMLKYANAVLGMLTKYYREEVSKKDIERLKKAIRQLKELSQAAETETPCYEMKRNGGSIRKARR